MCCKAAPAVCVKVRQAGRPRVGYPLATPPPSPKSECLPPPLTASCTHPPTQDSISRCPPPALTRFNSPGALPPPNSPGALPPPLPPTHHGRPPPAPPLTWLPPLPCPPLPPPTCPPSPPPPPPPPRLAYSPDIALHEPLQRAGWQALLQAVLIQDEGVRDPAQLHQGKARAQGLGGRDHVLQGRGGEGRVQGLGGGGAGYGVQGG